MNIAFIGYRTSGKTTISHKLANCIGWNIIETDHIIEEYFGKKIPEIIKLNGWDFFRKSESTIIHHYAGRNQLVIDLGGGAVLNEDAMVHLSRSSVIVFLDCSPETIINRMQKSYFRPPLTGLSLEEEVNKVLAERFPLYKRYADIIVNTDVFSADNATDIIMNYLLHYGIKPFHKNNLSFA
ncbi:MAG: shikimate kinase [Spirochaetes bacterium]|nr:shikimate kinase [Spirochaetota bacterium]